MARIAKSATSRKAKAKPATEVQEAAKAEPARTAPITARGWTNMWTKEEMKAEREKLTRLIETADLLLKLSRTDLETLEQFAAADTANTNLGMVETLFSQIKHYAYDAFNLADFYHARSNNVPMKWYDERSSA